MAVPTSGQLTLEGLAQECYYGTYGSGTITDPIYISDLINGGNGAGSGMVYPPINTQSPQHPNSPIFSDFYGYDSTYSPITTYPIVLYYDQFDPYVACANPGNQQTYYMDQPTYLGATQLWDNSAGTQASQPGFYAQITGRPRYVQEWDGIQFIFNSPC
jgi:hypothetical protein